MANRLELTCETKIERFADYPNIAIVSKTAYHPDIGGKSNRGITPRIFFMVLARNAIHTSPQ